MLQALFAGVSGLQSQQTDLDVIGNNISNVNTTGFKSDSVSFENQLSLLLSGASGANGSSGGTDPEQVGLGVTLGATKTSQTQGTLETTGNNTDLAISGNGLFLVSNNGVVSYTRDGNFDLDSSGNITNPSTGQRLLGFPADSSGVINTSAPLDATSFLNIPIGSLSKAQQTGNVGFTGNLDANASLYSTEVTYAGNLDSTANPNTTIPPPITDTVYDNLGNAHSVVMTFSNPVDNPVGASVPMGATRSWDVQVSVDGTITYDSTAGKSPVYDVNHKFELADASGNSLGSAIDLNGGGALNDGPLVNGANGASNFPIALNLGTLTDNAATSSVSGVADGNAGDSPVWGTSINVFDSLGISHQVSFQYSHVQLDNNAPGVATSEWSWTASENGKQIASSSGAGNSALYFDANGKLVGGSNQTISVTPTDGSISPFTVKIDNSQLSQLASTSSVTPGTQDGYPVGTLQSFNIASDGVITGVYSSGQSRALGQVALANFPNVGGLENKGGNLLSPTSNSGSVLMGVPGQAGLGTLNSGFLEQSNVDLSSEFTNLITSQRGFEANTKIVTTVDTLLQDLINLIR